MCESANLGRRPGWVRVWGWGTRWRWREQEVFMRVASIELLVMSATIFAIV